MKIRIVADSSANLKSDSSRNLISVPLKITSGEKTFVDDENLSVKEKNFQKIPKHFFTKL